jgi:hypothetical protein
MTDFFSELSFQCIKYENRMKKKEMGGKREVEVKIEGEIK